MAVNLSKIADTPYLSLYCNSTKQNDNLTMTFPVNLSLQCFRTAALYVVTLNRSHVCMQKIAQKRKNSWELKG